MHITILTLFPEMFEGPFDYSILKNAKEKSLLSIDFVNIRNFGVGTHQMVDDTPYGGGIGMVMRVDVLHKALKHARSLHLGTSKVVLLSAQGKTFNQKVAKDFVATNHLILVCGHYEGVDARIEKFIDEEVSVGDFITTGGEIPSMVIVDAVSRLIPGVLKEGVTDHESFSLKENGNTLVEYPHYTRPSEYEGESVPKVLVSGNHKNINDWRMTKAKEKTKKIRPDLIKPKKVDQ